MVFTLLRISHTDHGVFGVLRNENEVPWLVTCENPWKGNKPFISCIPEGTYTCKRIQSPKFGETFEVTGVPERTHILFHAGNRHQDTEGCILVGRSFGTVYGQPAIKESAVALAMFRFRFDKQQTFTLRVVDVEV